MSDHLDDWMKQLLPSLDPARTGEPCPDANLLAALATDALLPEEREAVLEHLATCASCRELALLSRDEDTDKPVRPAKSLRLMPLMLAAALAVLAVSLVVRSDPTPPAPDRQQHLLAAAQDLGARWPEALDDLRLTDLRDESSLPDTLRGNGLAARAPVGSILNGRPGFRWDPLVGASSYTVTVRTGAGAPVWQRQWSTSDAAYPENEADLVAGDYVWEVSATGVFGEERVSQSLRVLSAAEADRYRSAISLLQKADPEVRDLLCVHLALQFGLLEEAERHARRHHAAYPEDDLGKLALWHVLRRMGSPEADSVRPGEAGDH